jgi:hypothetical protein
LLTPLQAMLVVGCPRLSGARSFGRPAGFLVGRHQLRQQLSVGSPNRVAGTWLARSTFAGEAREAIECEAVTSNGLTDVGDLAEILLGVVLRDGRPEDRAPAECDDQRHQSMADPE